MSPKPRNSHTEILLPSKLAEGVRLVNPELVQHILATSNETQDNLPIELLVKDYIISAQDIDSNSNFLTRNLII